MFKDVVMDKIIKLAVEKKYVSAANKIRKLPTHEFGIMYTKLYVTKSVPQPLDSKINTVWFAVCNGVTLHEQLS
jgi:hypothetical protein